MITALRSINFSGCKPNQVQNNKQTNYSNSINQCKDMVSFSGSAKLSQKNNARSDLRRALCEQILFM